MTEQWELPQDPFDPRDWVELYSRRWMLGYEEALQAPAKERLRTLFGTVSS